MLLLALFIILALIGGGYYLYIDRTNSTIDIAEQYAAADTLLAINLRREHEQFIPNFVLDPTDPAPTVRVPDVDATFQNVTQNPAMPDQFAFVGYRQGEAIPQVFLAVVDELGTILSHQALTDTLAPVKSDLHWSADGRYLLYNEALTADGAITDINQRQIRIINIAIQDNQIVANGANASFSTDASFILHTKADGIYMTVVETGLSVPVSAAVGGDFTLYHRLVLNHARDEVIFTNHEGGYFAPATVNWQNHSITFGDWVAEAPATLVYSPDDTEIIFHSTVFTRDAAGDVIGMLENALVRFNLETGVREKLMDLDEYVLEYVQVSDWFVNPFRNQD